MTEIDFLMSISNRAGSRGVAERLGLGTLFFIATSLLFLGDHLNPGRSRLVGTAIPVILLSGLTIFLHRSARWHRYWEVSFAFLGGASGLFLAWNFPDSFLSVLGASSDTPQGVAVLKVFELLPVALGILVLTKLVQGSLAPIYVQKGNLRSGLGPVLILGLGILVIYLALFRSTIDPAKALPALPWLMIFAVSNAFFEELLIRGLFLKRFIALLGTAWAVILSALCYGLFFLGVQAAVGPIPFGALVVILPLGLLYGFVMQRSDSIWGPVSLHAVVDLIFLLGVFASS